MIYTTFSKEDWLQKITDSITDPMELLKILKLDQHHDLKNGIKSRRLFPFRVPRPFIDRMHHGDPTDPLLRQVITTCEEFNLLPGFTSDPLNEKNNILTGLLHKYKNRVLILLKNSCAINCRYCFRRNYIYNKNYSNKKNLFNNIDYIKKHNEIDEIILSGGDPLMAKDDEIKTLICLLDKIPHLTTLRIHSRLPVVIPQRITTYLCQILSNCRLTVILVTHINHANEIDDNLCYSITKLRSIRVILLNQSVLLRGVNDNSDTLANLSKKLLSAGILPYYLHVLDKVKNTSHFLVDDEKAKIIIQQLLKKVSGYLVPRLVKDISGENSKFFFNLYLH